MIRWLRSLWPAPTLSPMPDPLSPRERWLDAREVGGVVLARAAHAYAAELVAAARWRYVRGETVAARQALLAARAPLADVPVEMRADLREAVLGLLEQPGMGREQVEMGEFFATLTLDPSQASH